MHRVQKSTMVVLGLLAAAAMAGACSDDNGAIPADGGGSDAMLGISQPTKNTPLVVDEAKGEVHLYTEVNGRTFAESTRHGIVFKDGSNGDKPVLIAYADQLAFHDALEKIGAKPGNTLQADSPAGTKVTGDVLRVTMRWGDTVYDFAHGIKQEPATEAIQVHFGGNREAAAAKHTGCILCLDSCAVGITSNSGWGWNSWASGSVKFFADETVFPAAGSAVIVTFSLQSASASQ